MLLYAVIFVYKKTLYYYFFKVTVYIYKLKLLKQNFSAYKIQNNTKNSFQY